MCLFHRRKVAGYFLACLDASLDRILGGETYEQLELLQEAAV